MEYSRRAQVPPLQQFEVTEFELVGLFPGKEKTGALVQDASGKRVLDQGGDSHRQKPGPGWWLLRIGEF